MDQLIAAVATSGNIAVLVLVLVVIIQFKHAETQREQEREGRKLDAQLLANTMKESTDALTRVTEHLADLRVVIASCGVGSKK